MSDIAFTILLPVHRPPALLPYAIASVQAQELRDFELLVICDGAPPETAVLARRCAVDDPRIRVFEHPKGERNGEVYQHQALQEARGRYVCQIADDDLWLPNHLAEMGSLLRTVDFGHMCQVWITPDEKLHVDRHNLSDRAVRQRMLAENWNFFGPTTAGYRLSAYRSLPEGWSPAPREIASDLFMWRKFLARPELRLATRYAITSVHLATPCGAAPAGLVHGTARGGTAPVGSAPGRSCVASGLRAQGRDQDSRQNLGTIVAMDASAAHDCGPADLEIPRLSDASRLGVHAFQHSLGL